MKGILSMTNLKRQTYIQSANLFNNKANQGLSYLNISLSSSIYHKFTRSTFPGTLTTTQEQLASKAHSQEFTYGQDSCLKIISDQKQNLILNTIWEDRTVLYSDKSLSPDLNSKTIDKEISINMQGSTHNSSIIAQVPEYSSIDFSFPGDIYHIPYANIDSKIKGDVIKITNIPNQCTKDDQSQNQLNEAQIDQMKQKQQKERQIVNLRKTKGETVEMSLERTDLNLGSYLEAKEGFINLTKQTQGKGKRLGASESFTLQIEDQSSMELLGLFKNEEDAFSEGRIFKVSLSDGSKLQVENLKGCFKFKVQKGSQLKVKECNFQSVEIDAKDSNIDIFINAIDDFQLNQEGSKDVNSLKFKDCEGLLKIRESLEHQIEQGFLKIEIQPIDSVKLQWIKEEDLRAQWFGDLKAKFQGAKGERKTKRQSH